MVRGIQGRPRKGVELQKSLFKEVSNAAAVERILKKLKKLGGLAIDVGCKHSFQDQTARDVEEVAHIEELPLTDGTTFKWFMLDPPLLVPHLLRQPALKSAFREAWMKRPSSRMRPWRCAVAFDEYSAGNQLKIDNNRKVMVVNFCFLELDAWSCEDAWLTAAILRHNVAAKVLK